MDDDGPEITICPECGSDWFEYAVHTDLRLPVLGRLCLNCEGALDAARHEGRPVQLFCVWPVSLN
jgi:hypothetical protein